MAVLPILSSQSGPDVTVDDWIKTPTRIPRYTLSLMDQGFLADAVLRTEGSCPSGVVLYNESQPIYGGNVIEDRPEFGEIPVGRFGQGEPRAAYSRDKSLGIVVSEEMRDHNNVDLMMLGMEQGSNDMIKAWDDLFISVVLASGPQTFSAVSTWNTASYDVRADWLSCVKLIEGAQDSQGSELGYQCDTVILSRTSKYDIMRSKDFNTEYLAGNIADKNLRYTGKLDNKLLDLNVLVSPRVPATKAIFLASRQCGFISDEKPLFATPLKYDEDRPSWRSNIRRKAAVGIDQPKAIVIASNVSV